MCAEKNRQTDKQTRKSTQSDRREFRETRAGASQKLEGPGGGSGSGSRPRVNSARPRDRVEYGVHNTQSKNT